MKTNHLILSAALLLVGALAACGGTQQLPAPEDSPATDQALDAGAPSDAGPTDASAPLPDPQKPAKEKDEGLVLIDPGPMTGFGGEKYGGGPPPPPPKELIDDNAYLEKTFEQLVEWEDAPKFLTLKTLMRAIPGQYRREVKDEIEGSIREDGTLSLPVDGAYLDADKSMVVVRYQWGAWENVFLVLRTDGKLIGKLSFDKRTSMGMVADLVGDETKELIVPVVEGMGMSSWPYYWNIYEVKNNKLKRIGRVFKSFSYGSKYMHWEDLNTVTFPEKNKIRVETVIRSGLNYDEEQSKKNKKGRVGDVREYEYRRGAFRQTSFVKGPLDPDNLDHLYFKLAIHVATADREEMKKLIEKKLKVADDKYADVAVGFDVTDEWNQLPESFNVLDNSPERHKLKKYLVDRAINIFVVDEILDPHPSAATKKASGWQGRKPSGRLAGAHIEAKSKRPHTYIILSRRSSAISLTHELGHFFGLPHTKDPTNIMSYGSERTSFTPKQLETIRRVAERVARKRLVSTSE